MELEVSYCKCGQEVDYLMGLGRDSIYCDACLMALRQTRFETIDNRSGVHRTMRGVSKRIRSDDEDEFKLLTEYLGTFDQSGAGVDAFDIPSATPEFDWSGDGGSFSGGGASDEY